MHLSPPPLPRGLGCCPFLGGDSVVVVDFLFFETPILGVCNCSMFCCTLLYVHSSIAIILMGKRELVVLLNLSFWCLVMVEGLFHAVPWGFLWFVIMVFPDHASLYSRIEKLSLQYAIRLTANPSDPAHEVTFPPNYVDLYKQKPKAIKSFGIRISPLLESTNIKPQNNEKHFTPNIPSWCMKPLEILFD